MSIVHASSKGPVVLSLDVRKRYGITQGMRLEVIDRSRGTIALVPVLADPLAALDGMPAGAYRVVAYLRSIGVVMVPLDERKALVASGLKAEHPVSFADCMAGALALD